MNDELRKRFFITHSHADNAFAQMLANDLRQLGLDGFVDIYSINPGDNIPSRINKGLADCDVYVPILSNAALDSPWCKEEITAAIALSNMRDRDGRPRIIPVLVENCQQRISQEYPTLFTRLYILFVDRYDEALTELIVKGFGLSADLSQRDNSQKQIQGAAPVINSTQNPNEPKSELYRTNDEFKPTGKSSPYNLQTAFDRKKYKDVYKGFRFVSLEASNLTGQLRPMDLRDCMQKSIIYSRHGSSVFPTADPMYALEKRSSTGITFEHEYDVVGPTLAYSSFDLAAKIFAVESLWEDTRGTRFPDGSIGLFTCYRFIYTALLFGRKYYSILALDGKFQIQFSLESSIPRNLVMDARNYFPLFRVQNNDMSNPIVVAKWIAVNARLAEIDVLASQMIREFCWYFHLDLSEEQAITLLEKLKKEDVAIPKELLQNDKPNDKE